MNEASATEDSDIAQGIDATSQSPAILESEEDLEDEDTVVHDLLAEEILAESKEVQEETENLASENGDEMNLPFLPPIMNIELIKVCQTTLANQHLNNCYFFLFVIYFLVNHLFL